MELGKTIHSLGHYFDGRSWLRSVLRNSVPPCYTGLVEMGVGMSKLNVTLALPEELVKGARHMAVEEGISVSRLPGDCLVEMLREAQEYERAMGCAMARLRKGTDLGSNGDTGVSGEDLHGR